MAPSALRLPLGPSQIQGAVIASLLAAGWAASGAMRLRELRRVRRRAAGAAGPDPCRAPPLPHPDRCGASTQNGVAGRLGQLPEARCKAIPNSAVSARAGGSADEQGMVRCDAAPAAGTSAAEAGSNGRAAWPAVSVILPVKGARPHSHEAWRSHLALRYGATAAQSGSTSRRYPLPTGSLSAPTSSPPSPNAVFRI